MRNFRSICLFAALLATVLAATPQDLPRYSLVDLGTLGGSFTGGMAINARGQVTGASTTPGDAATHAFLYNNHLITDLGTLGGSYSFANAINLFGQITGNANLAGDMAYHAYFYSNHVLTDLGTLGGTFSQGVAINDRDHIYAPPRIISAQARNGDTDARSRKWRDVDLLAHIIAKNNPMSIRRELSASCIVDFEIALFTPFNGHDLQRVVPGQWPSEPEMIKQEMKFIGRPVFDSESPVGCFLNFPRLTGSIRVNHIHSAQVSPGASVHYLPSIG